MNTIFLSFILIAFGWAAISQLFMATPDGMISPMQGLSTAMISGAQDAVTLSLGLVGTMALFLGLMKVAEKGGLMIMIAKALRPLMIRLFPTVPAEHPAMGSMIMNFSANILGLANAATPFGIKAMQDLESLNSEKGTASDAMILFLAINTSSITLLPTGVIALRAAAGSIDPAAILPTTLFATICSTTIAILVAKTFARFSKGPASIENPDFEQGNTHGAYPLSVSIIALSALLALVPLSLYYGTIISPWVLPSIMLFFIGFGACRKVNVYEAFIEGAKDGFNVALRIIPYLVAILSAIAMLRASGALDAFVRAAAHLTAPLGLPAEALPMALLRPLSGSGAYGVLASTINDPAIGPDSYIGYLVSTLQGSTETTFYVLAVYFGAAQIKRLRYAIPAALCADLAGIIGAVVAVNLLLGA